MARTCPHCGGENLRQVTPGFYECLSDVTVGVIPPEVHGNPGPMPVIEPCGHRFQVAAAGPTPPCFCGRDSIGACNDCGRRLCGLHGTESGDFLCGACIKARATKNEEEERASFEEQVSVVRTRPPLERAEPACAPDANPNEVLDRLREECEQRGHPNLAGLAWTERYPSQESGEEWQLVRHFAAPTQGTRRVPRFLRSDDWQNYTAFEDRWLVYVHFEEVRRLCDVMIMTPAELSEHWRHMVNRVEGNLVHDLRWAEPLALPRTPDGEARPIPLRDGEPLYEQLVERQAEIGAVDWLGLAWTDHRDRRCRIVDDVLTQAHQVGLPTVYRTLVIEKEENGVVVDIEVCRDDAIKIRFNEIGRELGEAPSKAEFTWR